MAGFVTREERDAQHAERCAWWSLLVEEHRPLAVKLVTGLLTDAERDRLLWVRAELDEVERLLWPE